MRIKTGHGSIPLFSVLAIWSISAITALPGLSVTPILGDLDTIFTHVTDLDIQMITSFPNLFIIPFVLLSGKMSEKKNRIKLLIPGLIIFLLSGVLYMFAESITQLILISCLLGIGAGMVTPLSTGLVADFFVGRYRTKQMGLSSGINNLSLVMATMLSGWLATKSWHLPFLVYFIPVLPLLLSYFLTTGYLRKNNVSYFAAGKSKHQPQVRDDATITVTPLNTVDIGSKEFVENESVNDSSTINKDKRKSRGVIDMPVGKNINVRMLLGIVLIYFLLTYIIVVIAFNIAFVLQSRGIDSESAGSVISVLFLAIMLPGFFITRIIRVLKNSVFYLAISAIAIGLLFILFFSDIYLIGLGIFVAGIGYGTLQPLIYDKTSLSAKPESAVFALACVMSANYLAIYLCPFIASGIQVISGESNNMLFPFRVNMLMAVVFAIVAFFARKSVLFSAESSMFHSDEENN